MSRRVLAASLAQLGRLDDARREAALFMAAALYGYNPARGFVALTGKGE